MSRATRTVLIATFALVLPAVAQAQRAELAKARALYNERQFAGAIESATAAQSDPTTADAAAIVLARAHLERYREQADPSDLSAAREALTSVRAATLNSRDRIEFLLALGESLFLEDDFGAAAEVFESGLESAREDPELFDAMLDWWASAVERLAATSGKDARLDAFDRLSDRMTAELARNPASATASYWLVVALRGAGNAIRAWDAAVAGWARARLMGDRSAAFRSDINRLILDGIIPDRVRTVAPDQRAAAEAQLKAEWELVKEKWK
jgi:tetratricopeptide (TPR) repeat protein